jgi:hypothetical protein
MQLTAMTWRERGVIEVVVIMWRFDKEKEKEASCLIGASLLKYW